MLLSKLNKALLILSIFSVLVFGLFYWFGLDTHFSNQKLSVECDVYYTIVTLDFSYDKDASYRERSQFSLHPWNNPRIDPMEFYFSGKLNNFRLVFPLIVATAIPVLLFLACYAVAKIKSRSN